MINVLLPTNFSTDSLEPINTAAKMIPGKLNIILFHAFDMPDSLVDAMQRIGRQGYTDLITEALRLRCKQIKTFNQNINNICFKIMYGDSVATFKNFAEANKVDVIFLPAGHKFFPVVRESVDYERMFRKSGIKMINGSDESTTLDTDNIGEPLPIFRTINN